MEELLPACREQVEVLIAWVSGWTQWLFGPDAVEGQEEDKETDNRDRLTVSVGTQTWYSQCKGWLI